MRVRNEAGALEVQVVVYGYMDGCVYMGRWGWGLAKNEGGWQNNQPLHRYAPNRIYQPLRPTPLTVPLADTQRALSNPIDPYRSLDRSSIPRRIHTTLPTPHGRSRSRSRTRCRTQSCCRVCSSTGNCPWRPWPSCSSRFGMRAQKRCWGGGSRVSRARQAVGLASVVKRVAVGCG